MPEWINPDNGQLLGGFLISAAYIPQIMRMVKTQSSEDVSLGFLWLILISLFLMGWYSCSLYFGEAQTGLPLVLTNLLNLVMVIATLVVALKLRKTAKNDS